MNKLFVINQISLCINKRSNYLFLDIGDKLNIFFCLDFELLSDAIYIFIFNQN
jgi:hypothetical protein